MISKVLERRTTAPDSVLPAYNRDYSILEDCLGYKPGVKMARLHDANNKSKLCDIGWTCDGSKLVYSTRECVQLMNPQAFIPEVSIPGKWYKVISSSLNPLQLLCVSIVEPCLDFYDLRSKGPSFQITVPKDSFLNVAWSKDDKTVVTGDRTDHLHAIDMRFFTGEKASTPILESRTHRWAFERRGGTSKSSYKGISERKSLPYFVKSYTKNLVEIHDMAFSSDGKHLIMARNDGNLEITYLEDQHDIFNNNEKELVKAHIYGSTIVRESSGVVASFGQDQTISLLDLSSKSIISSMGGIDGLVSSIEFNHTVDTISVAISQGRKRHSDSYNDTLMLANMELKVLSRFDIPGRVVATSWHPYRQILALACNPLGSSSTSNTSSSNSGANASSVHSNKTVSSGLNGPNIPFAGFLTVE